MRELTFNIKRLSAARERNFRLLNLLRAHDAYQSLYRVLYNHCNEHKAHIIDFLLETSLPSCNLESDVRFRLSIEDSNYRSNENEVWLNFSAMHASTAVYGCLLSYGSETQHLPGREIAIQRQYSVADTQLVNDNNDRHRWKLSDINEIVEKSCSEGVITETDILHLCRRIATAVLKFNCTPFSSLVWGFRNIVLFFDDNSDRLLQEPHFSILLENALSANSESMFYCLGLVLYELWSFFPADKPSYKPILENLDPVQLLSVRVRIDKEMVKWMESGNMEDIHAEIIRWCLDAPKWTVEEMRDPKKLNEMYEKVICGLERVEMKYSGPLSK